MNDDQFVAAFESCTLPPDDFPHREHVRLAWIYYRLHRPIEAMDRFCTALKRFATSLGKPDRYHETITWALLLIIRDRMTRTRAETWEEFARQNEDLLRWNPSVLDRYYSAETLKSDQARREFVFPDLLGSSLTVNR